MKRVNVLRINKIEGSFPHKPVTNILVNAFPFDFQLVIASLSHTQDQLSSYSF